MSLGKEDEKNSAELDRKRVAMRCFSREILIYCHRHSEVLLFHWFVALSGVLISRRGTSWLGTFTSENLANGFGRNTSTLSEFIGYADSTDFCETSPEHSRDNNKPKCVGKLWYLAYFLRGVHLRTIFSYCNFRCEYLDNQSEYRKSPTHFCWLMPYGQDCAVILLVLWNQIADKFNRRTLGPFTPYRLLTHPERKHP